MVATLTKAAKQQLWAVFQHRSAQGDGRGSRRMTSLGFRDALRDLQHQALAMDLSSDDVDLLWDAARSRLSALCGVSQENCPNTITWLAFLDIVCDYALVAPDTPTPKKRDSHTTTTARPRERRNERVSMNDAELEPRSPCEVPLPTPQRDPDFTSMASTGVEPKPFLTLSSAPATRLSDPTVTPTPIVGGSITIPPTTYGSSMRSNARQDNLEWSRPPNSASQSQQQRQTAFGLVAASGDVAARPPALNGSSTSPAVRTPTTLTTAPRPLRVVDGNATAMHTSSKAQLGRATTVGGPAQYGAAARRPLAGCGSEGLWSPPTKSSPPRRARSPSATTPLHHNHHHSTTPGGTLGRADRAQLPRGWEETHQSQTPHYNAQSTTHYPSSDRSGSHFQQYQSRPSQQQQPHQRQQPTQHNDEVARGFSAATRGAEASPPRGDMWWTRPAAAVAPTTQQHTPDARRNHPAAAALADGAVVRSVDFGKSPPSQPQSPSPRKDQPRSPHAAVPPSASSRDGGQQQQQQAHQRLEQEQQQPARTAASYVNQFYQREMERRRALTIPPPSVPPQVHSPQRRRDDDVVGDDALPHVAAATVRKSASPIATPREASVALSSQQSSAGGRSSISPPQQQQQQPDETARRPDREVRRILRPPPTAPAAPVTQSSTHQPQERDPDPAWRSTSYNESNYDSWPTSRSTSAVSLRPPPPRSRSDRRAASPVTPSSRPVTPNSRPVTPTSRPQPSAHARADRPTTPPAAPASRPRTAVATPTMMASPAPTVTMTAPAAAAVHVVGQTSRVPLAVGEKPRPKVVRPTNVPTTRPPPPPVTFITL